MVTTDVAATTCPTPAAALDADTTTAPDSNAPASVTSDTPDSDEVSAEVDVTVACESTAPANPIACENATDVTCRVTTSAHPP